MNIHFLSTQNLQLFTCVLFLLSIRSVSSDNSYDWWGQCHVTLYLVVFLNATIHTRARVLSFFKTPIWRGDSVKLSSYVCSMYVYFVNTFLLTLQYLHSCGFVSDFFYRSSSVNSMSVKPLVYSSKIQTVY